MVGFVLQNYVVFDELTVFENLLISGLLRAPRNLTMETLVTRVEVTLRLLGLNECRSFVVDKHVGAGRLSGGQTRRVGIGIELVPEPSILMLDEPTSALDAVNTRIVVNIMKQVCRV